MYMYLTRSLIRMIYFSLIISLANQQIPLQVTSICHDISRVLFCDSWNQRPPLSADKAGR